MANLDPLFFPRAIAVIGASNRPHTIGHRIMRNLLDHGFTGQVHPVNPKATPILDQPAYASIGDVPGPVDLAHVIVKNTLVPDVLEQCAAKGVKVCIVNTSGFKETGPEGAELEKELVSIARRTGLRIFGPNCQGVMNTDARARLYSNFTFAEMTPGHISMVCQGGGVAEVINNYFGMNRIGQRMYASNGNACDISIPEILEYYGEDEETHVIVLHVESFANPREFLERVRPVAAKKPILALKSGVTPEGARAVSSHTGGLMAQDTTTDVIFDRCGVLRFHSLSELCETAQAFATQPIPRGNRVGMVTNAGSPAIIITDEAVNAGLRVPPLSPSSEALLSENLQAIASIANPIDMMATAGGPEFSVSLKALLEDPSMDAVVACFMTPFFVDTQGIATAIEEQAFHTDKPLIAVAMTNPGGEPAWRETVDRVKAAGVPVYYFPASAARVLFHMDRYRRLRDRPSDPPPKLSVDAAAARKLLSMTPPGDSGFLPAAAATELLRSYGIPVAREARGTTWEEVRAAAQEVGYPVVLKAEAASLVHKTEANAVVLDVVDEPQLQESFRALADRLADADVSFAVQSYLGGGLELIVGGARSEGLGATVMFGLGGIHVEIFKDVVFKLAPLGRPEAEEMLSSIRAAPLLTGYRGRPGVHSGDLVDVLLRVSRLMEDHPEIAELDLNPLMAFDQAGRTAAVDVRVRIQGPA